MPTKKVEGFKPVCQNPDHKPPMFQVFEPGKYEHTCPSCGHVTKFTVPLTSIFIQKNEL